MRASLHRPVVAGLKSDHRVTEWFWDHQVRFCRARYERDQRRIATYLATASKHTLPPSSS